MESRRLLDSKMTVVREGDGVRILLGYCDQGPEELLLTAAELRRLLAFAERGEEPPPTPDEVAAAEGARDFARFLDSLLK